MHNRLKKWFSGIVFVLLLVGLLPQNLYAATTSYAALMVTGSNSLSMAPGETKSVSFSFQNIGSETWKNDGTGYISLYTYDPKYRKSDFDPGTWLSGSQVKRISEVSVKPNGVGTFTFGLHAPSKEGTYKETFALAAEDKAWVTGGTFTITIKVAKASTSAVGGTGGSTGASTTTSVAQTAATSDYSSLYTGQVTAQTADSLKAVAGKNVSFLAVVKNTGVRTWNSLSVTSDGSEGEDFKNSTWQGSTLATLSQTIKPQESGTVQFFFTTPKVNGSHAVSFNLSADGNPVSDAEIDFTLLVTGGVDGVIASPVSEETSGIQAVNLIDEPVMRVAVLIVDEETDDEVYVTSYESDFDLKDTDGNVLGSYSKGEKVHAAYENGKYYYGPDNAKSALPLRFVPKTPNAVMTITNFDRRLTRGAAKAYNTFRNVLELRYNSSKDRTWVINELPMEYYLRGLAETSNLSNLEFQKALLTAARTYAFYHYTHASKHASEGYHVDAYSDQVYWGYGQEEQTPRITQAVEETRGDIVTYNGDTAITAYFSRSDGRTRDWSEVWGGSVPWSKSVSVPCDVGKTLWGHGVGMSASGALCMANDGKGWEEILKYFYTGIDVTQRWK